MPITKPACKKMRSVGTDLYLKSGIRPIDTKCKIESLPGQHGTRKRRIADYALQLRAKQRLRRVYGIMERQFRRYYQNASRMKGSTGVNLLQKLEARLDNVVYRAGFASTRAEARQLVSHKAVLVYNQKRDMDRVISIPSYEIKPGDMIKIAERAKGQLRIQGSLELAQQKPACEWIEVEADKLRAVYKTHPDRDQLPSWYEEQLVVELYSK